MLKPLPERCAPVRERRLRRRVASDCFVDVDTIRYSVPHRLVKQHVEVLVGDSEVIVFDGAEVVARHPRHFEPHQRVEDRAHLDGLYRATDDAVTSGPAPMSRGLNAYADAIGGAS
jgi:hypothetical protein